ncbi:hypothetical protein [Flavobacterium pallidum]|uniref:Uncharacterized protein n=1 Tax=Flavobacterium pallidum TaxID=2172098 RepID=A0A2S1SE48_9FLAO|nr:hypothetical protein [Flavobacterium pallidum]AWI24661.1 hypothetical protein HYN49_01450 [Flavobacterium pallidum]
MAQHKLEENFRDKLNQREITPSANAWDRLDAMLTVAEKPKKKYGWIYIAASILGFLFIGMVFLSQTAEMTDVGKDDNQVTVHESNAVKDTVKDTGANEINSDAVINETVVAETQSSQASQNNKTTPHQNNQSSIKIPITNEALPVIEKISQNQNNQIAERQQNPEPAVNQTLASNTKRGTEVNVDELLASVSKTKKPATAAPAVKVNANSLLSQVDGEITLTFRERVIRTANKNYQNVKVALANRNKE